MSWRVKTRGEARGEMRDHLMEIKKVPPSKTFLSIHNHDKLQWQCAYPEGCFCRPRLTRRRLSCFKPGRLHRYRSYTGRSIAAYNNTRGKIMVGTSMTAMRATLQQSQGIGALKAPLRNRPRTSPLGSHSHVEVTCANAALPSRRRKIRTGINRHLRNLSKQQRLTLNRRKSQATNFQRLQVD